MERRIDLDAAAREIAARVPGWRATGMLVGELTWRDDTQTWPRELATNRADVRDPDSIGVRCTKGDREGALVLFRGGWADLEFWSGDAADEPVLDHPGYPNALSLETLGALLDRFGALFE